MPVLGLGVWQIPEGRDTVQAVLYSLKAGYRLVDTAKFYKNEKSVGEAIRESGVPREEIFVTTKLWPSDFISVQSAFNRSLEKLNTGYIDLYLIHYPVLGIGNRVWKTLEQIYKNGLVRAIGVSNYSISQLENLLELAEVPPAVNQVEFHPFEYKKELLEFCREKNITLEAYSPLDRGRGLNNPVIVEIAKNYNKTQAQILIRWGLQHGAIVIPKSAREDHIRENINVFDFEISENDMEKLDSLSG